MTSEIKIKRGTKSQLPTLELAEPGFVTDSKELYIGDGTGNIKIGGNSTFLEHVDSPATYTSYANNVVAVNNAESGLEFKSIDLTPSTLALMVYNTNAQTDVDTAESLQLEGIIRLDSGFSMGGTNSTEITISGAGWYEFQYSVAWDSDYSNRSTMRVYVERAGLYGWEAISQSYSYEYLRHSTYGRMSNNTASFFLNSSEGEKFRVRMDGATTGSFPSTSVDSDTINNQCWVTIKSLDFMGIKGKDGKDGSDGDDGVDGSPGPPGSGSSTNVYHEGSTISGSPFSTINFNGLNVAPSVTSGTVDVTHTPSIFGTWYGWETSESQSTTTSTSWQLKLRYSLSDIPAGYYRIGYQWEWRRNHVGTDFKSRVQIDDTSTVANMNYESKDVHSWHLDQGFYIANLTAGNHYIDIDYCGESSSYTNYIRAVRIECYRVS